MPAEAIPIEPSATPVEPPITPLFGKGEAPVAAEPRQVLQVNFRQPSLLTAAQLRKLSLRHEEFCRLLATRFSIYLRLEFGVKMLGLETMYYSSFCDKLGNPSHLTLFRLAPLPGTGLLEVPRSLSLSIVDRLCGGNGKVPDLARDLSEIETAVLDQALRIILTEWGRVAAGLPENNPDLAGHETNPRFLPPMANDAGMLSLQLEVQLAERVDKITLGFPFEMVEPLVRQLQPAADPRSKTPARPSAPLKWNPELNGMRVPLSVAWEGVEITARQLAHLKVGDVLPIESHHLQRTALRLAKVTKFTGRLGKCARHWAIELTAALTR